MDIVIIGAGNVATVLGHLLHKAGHRITQILGRNPEKTGSLAAELHTVAATRWEDLDADADCYLVSIPDEALRTLARERTLPGRLIVHTAGALPLDLLRPVSDRCGVFYPLQSLRKEIRPFPEIPLLVDATHSEDLERLQILAKTISPNTRQADDATRLQLHLSAIFVNNFPNYLFTLAAEYCRTNQIGFDLLLPLIHETVARLAHFPPADVQTGPAIRGDRSTLEKHLSLLPAQPEMKEVYLHLSRLIWQHYQSPENPFPL